MMDINFYLFLAMCELILVLFITIIIQSFYLLKYRPYFIANTKPELTLKKYLQRLIYHTQKFSKGLEKSIKNGDAIAIQTCQQLNARLNWLVLERDNVTTVNFDIRYWENLNNHINKMLAHWKEAEYIQEPPDIAKIQLMINGHKENFDYENADVAQSIKDQISALKQKIETMSKYEILYKEANIEYKTLQQSYADLLDIVNEFNLETSDANKLKAIRAEHIAKQENA
ncbi:MAG TPA: hypothetical protein ENK06_13325 [Gammaproteobacteria bacterium]|nr:hypothetical protein [Gammaproteobacteria bacterium]